MKVLGGSHGFQGEQVGDQSPAIEYKGGGGYRKLTTNEWGDSKNITELNGEDQLIL